MPPWALLRRRNQQQQRRSLQHLLQTLLPRWQPAKPLGLRRALLAFHLRRLLMLVTTQASAPWKPNLVLQRRLAMVAVSLSAQFRTPRTAQRQLGLPTHRRVKGGKSATGVGSMALCYGFLSLVANRGSCSTTDQVKMIAACASWP